MDSSLSLRMETEEDIQSVIIPCMYQQTTEKEEKGRNALIVDSLLFLTENAEAVALFIGKGGIPMTKDQELRCAAIIHTASVAAAGVGGGLAQVPGGDNALLTPIQLTMTISLGAVFGITLTQTTALAAIGSAAAHTIGRTVSQFLVGWIPGFGNVINATTAAGLTESMGWALANEFDKQSNQNF